MVKGINNDLYKAAMKLKDEDAKRQQVAGIIQAIGGAGSGLIGAYSQRQQMDQQQQAAAQLGGQLGFSPQVAGQLDVGQLATMAYKAQQSELLQKQQAQQNAALAAAVGFEGDASAVDPDTLNSILKEQQVAKFKAGLPADPMSPNDAALAEKYVAEAALKKHELAQAQAKAAKDASFQSDEMAMRGRLRTWKEAKGLPINAEVDPAQARDITRLSQGDFETRLTELGKTSRLGTQIQSREGLAQRATDFKTRVMEAKNDLERQRLALDELKFQVSQGSAADENAVQISIAILKALESPFSPIRGQFSSLEDIFAKADSLTPPPRMAAPAAPAAPAGPVPSAPAATVPPSAAPTDDVMIGPNGELIRWNGAEWIPVK